MSGRKLRHDASAREKLVYHIQELERLETVSCPVRVFSHVLASIAPPPEMKQPPLWSNIAAVETLDVIAWPPSRDGGGRASDQ